MKILLDTNVFIAAEPVHGHDIEYTSPQAAELLRLMQEGRHDAYVHPAAAVDIARDANELRREVRRVHFNKYQRLPAAVPAPPEWTDEFPAPEADSNDAIDLQHLAAVAAYAVDYLVTEDRGLHRKARRLGLAHQVVTIADALSILRALFQPPSVPPPAVDAIVAYELNEHDVFFDSLRADYPHFDEWLRDVKLQHRRGWVVKSGDDLAALCLVKEEGAENDAGLTGKVLKLSILKVGPEHAGHRYGELLLKTVFGHAAAESYGGMYITVFEDKHPGLVALLEDFGFFDSGKTTRLGETILCKVLTPPVGADDMDPLAYHIAFGPPAVRVLGGQTFLVPIQPRYAERLFPEARGQMLLPAGTQPYGNALRKAYLCKTASRQVRRGATLLFYRSNDMRALFAVGVVDDVLVSKDPLEIAAAVGTRTVYSMDEIERMSARGKIVVYLFRQDRLLGHPVPLPELVAHGVVRGSPQTVTAVQRRGVEWARQRLA